MAEKKLQELYLPSSNGAEVNALPTSSAPYSSEAYNTPLKSTNTPVLERNNSMVILDDFQHDRQRFFVTILVGSVACLAVVTSLTAMYVEASIAAYIAFIIPLVVAPYTIHQRRQINKLPSLLEEIKKCQNQVARLAAENLTLHTNINNLTAQVQKLADVDDQLAAIAKSNNDDIATLRMLIYTHGSIQRQMKHYVQAQDLQQLLKTLLACETDKNFVIPNSELDKLLLRLEILGSRIPKDVLKEAIENATMKQQSTTNLYRTLLNLDLAQGCGDCYVQYTDFEEHKMA